MRTLPLRLAPVEGESLPSYVARYAHTFGLQPGDVVRALGLDVGGGSVAAAGHYGVSLSREQLQRASTASGIATKSLEGMLLTRFAGRAFAGSSVTSPVALSSETQAHEVLTRSTRLCPRCLRKNGAWLLRWQLGWSVVCVRHRVMLQRYCPKCEGVPRIGTRARWPHDQTGELSDPSRCSHRRGSRLCRASLETSSSIPEADTALVSAQCRIDAVLDGQDQPVLAGEQLEPPAYLSNLRALSVLIRARSEQTRQPTGGAGRILDDPIAFAKTLPEAIRLADLTDHDALTAELRELAEQRYRKDGRTPRLRDLGEISPPLRDALLRAKSESSWASPSSQMGFDPHAHRRPDELDPNLDARHVPQLFWTFDYERELAELFDFDDFSDRMGRRFCSILLARMLTPLDWHAAVRYLDLPQRFVNATCNTMFVKLRQNGRFDELATRIKRLANEHARDLIDYKQRRTRLSGWAGIDPHTWLLLQPRARPATEHVDPPARRAHASVWLWCELTSGDQHAAPVSLPSPALHDHTIFVRRFIPPLRERLLLLGELLLNTPSHAHETLPARLAAVLHERGYLAPNYYLDRVEPLIAERILAHTSAHTGVDITTLASPPCVSHQPPGVRHARILAAALLRKTALASWPAIASTLGGSTSSLSEEYRAYSATLERSPSLAAELDQLESVVEAWQTRNPATPTTPHRQRMRDTALAIKARATELFTRSHGTDLARRTSILACRLHTDLTWDTIAAIHHVPAAQPAFSQATITRRRRTDPDFNHRYRQLLDHARQTRRQAGFARADLTRGLARGEVIAAGVASDSTGSPPHARSGSPQRAARDYPEAAA